MAKSHDHLIPQKKLKNRVADNSTRHSIHHIIPPDIANNQDVTQQTQKDYSSQIIQLSNSATLLLCLAVMFETSSKYIYIEKEALPHISDHKDLLFWKYFLATFFFAVLFFVDVVLISCIIGDDASKNSDSSLLRAYKIISLTNVIAILLLGIASDAMPFGNEGNPLLTWNKFGQMANNDKFSYSLTYYSDPNYNIKAYRNGVLDFYNVDVHLNRVLNYTEIDRFLTNHNCTVDDLASFLRSIRSFSISTIYC